jgi:hypothetical protein
VPQKAGGNRAATEPAAANAVGRASNLSFIARCSPRPFIISKNSSSSALVVAHVGENTAKDRQAKHAKGGWISSLT